MIKIRYALFAKSTKKDEDANIDIQGVFSHIFTQSFPASLAGLVAALGFYGEHEDQNQEFSWHAAFMNTEMPAEFISSDLENSVPEILKKYRGLVFGAEGNISVGSVKSGQVTDIEFVLPLDSAGIPAPGRHLFVVQVENGPRCEVVYPILLQEEKSAEQ